LQAFAETAQVPVYLNGSARGSLPPGHALLCVRSRREALAQADVILVIGTPFDFRLAYGKRLAGDAQVIQVDLDYGEIGHNRGVDVGIAGDAAAVLGQLTAALADSDRVDAVPADRRAWLEHLRSAEQKALEKDLPLLHSDAVPVHPLRLAREINDFLTDDTVFIGDGGDVVTISASVIQPRRPGHWLDPGPLGTLGVGMPFAIAAKVALPHREAFVLFGDGAFGFNGFEFDTAVRFNLPVVSVVGNNAAWNQIRYGQITKYGAARGDTANLLAPTRYDQVVEALGGHGKHVTEPKDIRPALERARASGRPACVNVMIDPNVYSSGTMNQTMYK
jgi:acetolactate synthase-1/2/3 large subunit